MEIQLLTRVLSAIIFSRLLLLPFNKMVFILLSSQTQERNTTDRLEIALYQCRFAVQNPVSLAIY